jgi:uncharacterized protein
MVKNKNEITDLLLAHKNEIQQFGAKSIGLFGSFVTNSQNDRSDIDLIVEFEDGKKTFNNYISLVYFFEDLFKRKVELITPESISKYLKPHILSKTEYVPISL